MQNAPSFSSKQEIAKYTAENNVKILNLCHVPEDGRLKTLSFAATDKNRVSEILEYGERVDGSNLFSFIETGKSDIYIMPRADRAFVNPFAGVPTLNVMCDYLDEHGKLLDVAPKTVLLRAEDKLFGSQGVVLRALAELEFYVMARLEGEPAFAVAADRGYHESAPFARFEGLRNEVLATLANVGVATKYGHNEVGSVCGKDNVLMEQQEIEFLPDCLADMAETVAVAKWVVRNVCAKYGVSVSFSPKVALEHAGSGMHVHLCVLRNGVNVVADGDGGLSADGLKVIGGLLKFARGLSAFGNTVPVSYLRFAAHKESPMHVCWSGRNRLALVRVPLWWSFKRESADRGGCRETVEFRGPDPLANVYLLFAGLALAVEYGLTNSQEALRIAEVLHVEEGGRKRKGALKSLPLSCGEAAGFLLRDRRFYEAGGVFPKVLVDKTVERLRACRDWGLLKDLADKPAKAEGILKQYLHCG